MSDFDKQIKGFIERIERMKDKEKEYLEWLKSVNADYRMIHESEKFYKHYTDRLEEYKEYYENLKTKER